MAKLKSNKHTESKAPDNKEARSFASKVICDLFNKAYKEVFCSDGDDADLPKITQVPIPSDGTPTELSLPDNVEAFMSEGKVMVRFKKKDEAKNEEGDGEKEEETITYEQIAKDLYKDKSNIYYWVGDGDETKLCSDDNDIYAELSNCMSIGQVKRLMAINKLQNIALYLNDGWHPNFKDKSKKYVIVQVGKEVFDVFYTNTINDATVYFKTEELAKEAIKIMGEESLSDLFNTDW